jgi:hypothetical protein
MAEFERETTKISSNRVSIIGKSLLAIKEKGFITIKE